VAGTRAATDRELFDSIAARHAAKDLTPSSRRARRLRLERTLSVVQLQPSWRVLEVGCGAGFAATYLRGRIGEYVGIDHSQALIEIASDSNAADRVKFVASSIEAFEPPHTFDLVFMVGVLHHLEHKERELSTLVGFLKPGGYLVANEPQPANPFVSLARRLRGALDDSYSSEQEEICRRDLRNLLAGSGLGDIVIQPQGLLSTPFAELVLKPGMLAQPLSLLACSLDAYVEPRLGRVLLPFSWNLIAVGRRPGSGIGR